MQLSNLTGKTVAIMVASGFDEDTFIAIQRVMMSVNAKLRVISRDAGLTNAWNGSDWGMSYPVDGTLATTLAIDYDALIVPTGERHVATEHQIPGHYTRARKSDVGEDALQSQ